MSPTPLTRDRLSRRLLLVASASLFAGALLASFVSAFTITCGTFANHAGSYLVNPNFRDSIAGTPAQQSLAVQQGADSWTEQGDAKFEYIYAGTTTISNPSPDQYNVVFSTNQSGGSVLAEAFCYLFGGERYFDIRFYDGNHSWNYDSSGGRPGYDIPGIACHEFGHALGLGHSSISGSTMWPSALGDGVANRSIEADDIAGIQFLYGENLPPVLETLDPSSGTVSGGTRVTLLGSGFFDGITRVFFGENEGSVLRWVSRNELWVIAPPGTSLGPADITLKDRFAGDFVYPLVYEYTESPVRLLYEGFPSPGATVTVRVEGPPGARYGIASSTGTGSFFWRDLEFCLGEDITTFMRSIGPSGNDPPLDALGAATKPFPIPASAQVFDEYSLHGVVVVDGQLVQTNKLRVQVLPR